MTGIASRRDGGRQRRRGAAVVALALDLAAGAAEPRPLDNAFAGEPINASQERTRMWMTVGGQRFAVTLEDNPTARAFAQLLPVSLEMAELNGNEKHARLPRSLPTSAARPGTIRAGDVLLYGSDTLVVFYETFRSEYSYTRIARIEQSAGLARALGPGDARVTFAMP